MRSIFSIIAMSKKSQFTIFVTQNCTKHEKAREFDLYRWDRVCKVNEWCLVDYFHLKFSVSTQIMVRNYCIAKCRVFRMWRAFNGPLGHFFCD